MARKTITSYEVKQRYDKKTYKRYQITLRYDTDTRIIEMIEKGKAGGIPPTQIIRNLYNAAIRNAALDK